MSTPIGLSEVHHMIREDLAGTFSQLPDYCGDHRGRLSRDVQFGAARELRRRCAERGLTLASTVRPYPAQKWPVGT